MLSLGSCAVEVMDSSMDSTDGADETTDNSHGHADSGSIARESVPHGRVGFDLAPPEGAVRDEWVHDSGNAAGDADRVSPEDSAVSADNRRTGPDHHDRRDVRVDGQSSESDDDCNGEATCLEACISPSGQDYYLRRGGTPRRRSALRLSRIIARQQLLRRLSQGRNRDCCQRFAHFFLFFLDKLA